MSDFICQLKDHLLSNTSNRDKNLLQCLSIYQCYKPQKLSHVSFTQPTMLIVLKGHKEVNIHDKSLSINNGDLLILPPSTTMWIGNFPDNRDSEYLGMGFRFDKEALDHFRLIYGSSLKDWDTSAKFHAKVPDSIIIALHNLLNWNNQYQTEAHLTQHRQVEILLLLAQEGLVGNILLGEHPSWKQRIIQLLSTEPARSWVIGDACTQFGVSESSLRRNLRLETSNFRELLEEARLSHGLYLLLETAQPIGRVADASGYQSQSRFGERFKLRFGMTPSELRRTQIA